MEWVEVTVKRLGREKGGEMEKWNRPVLNSPRPLDRAVFN